MGEIFHLVGKGLSATVAVIVAVYFRNRLIKGGVGEALAEAKGAGGRNRVNFAIGKGRFPIPR